MADAAKKIAEVPKQTEATGGASAAPEGKRKIDLLGLVSVLLVAGNLAAVGGLGVYLKKMVARMTALEAKVEEVATAQAEENTPSMKEKMTGRMLTPPTPGALYPMESFLVNISSDQGPKFLQTQMEFELMDAATEDEISKKKSAIRDAIIVLLSSRSYKQIRDTSGMLNLRRDILRVVNNLLTTGQVREVYFTQFHFN